MGACSLCAIHMFTVLAHTVVQAINTNCIVLLNLCIAPLAYNYLKSESNFLYIQRIGIIVQYQIYMYMHFTITIDNIKLFIL